MWDADQYKRDQENSRPMSEIEWKSKDQTGKTEGNEGI
jgi:hypothetical protein